MEPTPPFFGDHDVLCTLGESPAEKSVSLLLFDRRAAAQQQQQQATTTSGAAGPLDHLLDRIRAWNGGGAGGVEDLLTAVEAVMAATAARASLSSSSSAGQEQQQQQQQQQQHPPVNTAAAQATCFSIVTLAKTAFNVATQADARALLDRVKPTETLGVTDVYGRYRARLWSSSVVEHEQTQHHPSTTTTTPPADDLYIKTIHPCTLAHIRSALPSTTHILRETAATYRSVVEPYIASIPASRTAWVRDILSGKAEADDALFSDVGANGENGAASANDDGGFVVVPDIKWDQRTARGLYVQVIVGEAAVVRRGGARCLRDLRAHHLPLLRRIRATVMDVVPKRYPSMVAAPTQLRLLVHYLPSYYHLHVHVVHADYDGSGGGGGAGGGGGLLAGRAHLLDDVIAHLEMDGDWYAKADLFVAVPESHDLFRPLMEAERGTYRTPS